MSSSDRRTLLRLLAALPLAGCGFSPVYGPAGSGNLLRDRLWIAPPNTRLGFVLVARLEDRLGRATAPSHELDWELEITQTNLALTGANAITRINLLGELTFLVTEAGSDVPVQEGTVSTFTAYSTTGSPVSTDAARRDAEDRLMVALADQLVSRLLAGAYTWP